MGLLFFFSCLFFFSHSSHVILGMPSPLFPYHCLSSQSARRRGMHPWCLKWSCSFYKANRIFLLSGFFSLVFFNQYCAVALRQWCSCPVEAVLFLTYLWLVLSLVPWSFSICSPSACPNATFKYVSAQQMLTSGLLLVAEQQGISKVFIR